MSILIQENIPLKDKNWFHIGGPARYFCEPSNATEFQKALAFAREKKLKIFLLGHGANILVHDNGFDGLVIRPKKTSISIDIDTNGYALVTAGAGVSMDELIHHTLNSNLIGLEVFSNIPGTVGGSVYINLHYFDHFISHFLINAQVIEKNTGTILDVDNAWFNFGYDQSTLIKGNYYLIKATFQLKHGNCCNTAYAWGRRYEITRHRTARYPKSHTCGSFFRNFLPKEVTLCINNNKMVHIAFYLDQVGVKGICFGDACVSSQHVNMLINKKNATSKEIIKLARTLQKKVLDRFNVTPQPECIFVGFDRYPLW